MQRIAIPACWPSEEWPRRSLASKLSVAVQATQVNRLVAQVVNRSNVPDRAAAGPHQDGVRDRLWTRELYSWQQGTIADAGRTKEGALALNQIVHAKNAS